MTKPGQPSRARPNYVNPAAAVVTMGEFAISGIEVTANRTAGGDVLLRVVHTCRCVDTGRTDAEVNTREAHDGESWGALTAAERGLLVKGLVMRALEHEVDEWLRVDGERVQEPHAWNRAADGS